MHVDRHDNAKQMLQDVPSDQYPNVIAMWATDVQEQWSTVRTKLMLHDLDMSTQAYVSSAASVWQGFAAEPKNLLEAAKEENAEQPD